jgi:peptide/nickel transport system permease protein
VIVSASLDPGAVIIAAAALSFIGLGAQPPLAEWGLMMNEGRPYVLNAWWISTFPGLAVFVLVLSTNLLGDGVRDALDPRSMR